MKRMYSNSIAKGLFLTLLAICTASIASDIAVVPQKDHGIIVKITGSKMETLAKINIPYLSSTKITKSGKIVTLDKKNAKLIIHEINGTHIKDIPVPLSSAINVKNDIVYIAGGNENGEMCAFLDLNDKKQEIKYIDLPIKGRRGKAVDDVLIVDDKMVLVDNIVYPKYLFEYDISTETNPRLVKTRNLRGRTYEHVIKGDINNEWMVVLSNAVGRWGSGQYITIYGVYSKVVSYVRKFSRRSKTKLTTARDEIFDILLVNDNLYIATSVGLGYIELDREDITIEDMTFVDTKLKHIHRMIKVGEDKILLINIDQYELLDTKKLNTDKDGYKKLDVANYKIWK